MTSAVKEKKILIADNSNLVRFGFINLLPKKYEKNIDEVDNCNDLLDHINKKQYSHLILDYYLDKGDVLKVLKTIREHNNDIIIILYTSGNKLNYDRLLSSKYINVFLDKDLPLSTLKKKMKALIELEDVNLLKEETVNPNKNPFHKLSQRQQVVLKYLLEGYSTKDIAFKMGIRNNTVSTMKTIMFNKLGINTLIDLVHLAGQYGIAEL